MGSYFQQYYPYLLNEYVMARNSIYRNPDHSMIKLGIIAENLAREVIQHYNLPLAENTQLCRLNTLSQYSLLPDDIAGILHDIRQGRNQASHEGYVNAQNVANLFTWMDNVIAWFENMMLVQHKAVYQRPHSTYGINGIAIEVYVYGGMALLMLVFFLSIIQTYIMNKIGRFVPYIVVFSALACFLYMRIRKRGWPFWIIKLKDKLKEFLLKRH